MKKVLLGSVFAVLLLTGCNEEKKPAAATATPAATTTATPAAATPATTEAAKPAETAPAATTPAAK